MLPVPYAGIGRGGLEVYFGTSEIPLPPPSPVAIPKLAILERQRAIGTAKLTVLAYDVESKSPVINAGYTLARSDHKTWNILGFGGVNSGSVHEELATNAGDVDTFSVPAMASAGTRMLR